jgi:hypothetical protein
MPDKTSTKPARGTRDFLPDDLRRREHVIGIVRDVYQRYGFEPLETPAFENIETLMGKYGEEGNQLIFKILKRGEHEKSGEADLALRYDLTVPLARVVAEHQGTLPTLFKRYQIQPVWRADRPARGRFREFYQCDIDAIGSTSPIVEAEILGAVSEILTALGFNDFAIRINHRMVLAGLLNAAGVHADRQGDAMIALDKLDKIGVEGVEREFVARGIDQAAASAYLGHSESRGRVAGGRAGPAVRRGVGRERHRESPARSSPSQSRRRRPGASGSIRSLARGLSLLGRHHEIAVKDQASAAAAARQPGRHVPRPRHCWPAAFPGWSGSSSS